MADGPDRRRGLRAARPHRRAARERGPRHQVPVHHGRADRRPDPERDRRPAGGRLLRLQRPHRRHRPVHRRRSVRAPGARTARAQPAALSDRYAVRHGRWRRRFVVLRRHRRGALASLDRPRCPRRQRASHPLRRRPAAVPRDPAQRPRVPRRPRLGGAGRRRARRHLAVVHVRVAVRLVGHVRRQRQPHLLHGVPVVDQPADRAHDGAGLDGPDAAHRHRRAGDRRGDGLRGRLERHDVRAPGIRRRRTLALPRRRRTRRGLRPDRVLGRRHRRRHAPRRAAPGDLRRRAPPLRRRRGRRLAGLDARPVDGHPRHPHRVRVVARRVRRRGVRRPRHAQPGRRPHRRGPGRAAARSTR